MKRIIIALMTIFFSFYFGGEVFAAGYKPPSAICFNFPGTSDYLIFTLKAVGKATMADGPTQFYAVNGAQFHPIADEYSEPWSIPIAGTGYVSSGQFNFWATGSYYSYTFGQGIIDLLGYWSIAGGSGSYISFTHDYYGDYSGFFWIQPVDCGGLTIPPVMIPIF